MCLLGYRDSVSDKEGHAEQQEHCMAHILTSGSDGEVAVTERGAVFRDSDEHCLVSACTLPNEGINRYFMVHTSAGAGAGAGAGGKEGQGQPQSSKPRTKTFDKHHQKSKALKRGDVFKG